MRERKSLPSWLVSAIPAPLLEKTPKTAKSHHDAAQDYLTGVRGCLAIMSFLWVFMQTFAPGATYGSSDTVSPSWQAALRKSLSVLFWNGSLIYSSIIFLSARTVCLPFLLNPTKLQLASSVFRRGLRLWFPTAAALVVCYIAFSNSSPQYLADFAATTGTAAVNNGTMVDSLYIMPTSIVNFNSIFEIFWVSHNFSYQAGNWAFPTQTLWVITAIFQQSYTVFAVMVIIPFTRKSWRLSGATFFILTAWWVYSWAWFSISGLLLADMIVSMDFKAKFLANRIWTVSVGLLCMAAGFAMEFIWATIRPELRNAEIKYHTGLYSTGGINTTVDATAPQLRADNYLVIVGFFVLLESTHFLQKAFANPVFTFLGRRSLSYFLLQSIIVYTLGIRVAMEIMNGSIETYSRASGVAFIASLLVTVVAGEVFYWLLDVPSQQFARLAFAWILE
ncbi:hypothetical protein LTR78_006443 [Recurvomyces mirabilis]|uniref:Acyltransferase 3 domain-containing protein n=1 Tax=Recurvomyces mirabilis TaxID=574656 RepID=A0AAE1BZY9_9PEZI|nr:hypothetical protein LTR78_006443 [Recurvomyces mirabilis]KAK5151138.1 hypothetical protein LTS14_009634 [Recurvomyces mirabilis]